MNERTSARARVSFRRLPLVTKSLLSNAVIQLSFTKPAGTDRTTASSTLSRSTSSLSILQVLFGDRSGELQSLNFMAYSCRKLAQLSA
jgi:hypothetical protein